MADPEKAAQFVRDMLAADNAARTRDEKESFARNWRGPAQPMRTIVVHPVTYWAIVGLVFGLLLARDNYVLSVIASAAAFAAIGALLRYTPRLIRWGFGRLLGRRR